MPSEQRISSSKVDACSNSDLGEFLFDNVIVKNVWGKNGNFILAFLGEIPQMLAVRL